MASWREVARPLRQLRISNASRQATPVCARRWASAEAAAAAPVEIPAYQDLEPDSTQAVPGPTRKQIKRFADPYKRASERKYQLPASRYVFATTTSALGPKSQLDQTFILICLFLPDTNITRQSSYAALSTPSKPLPPPTRSRETSCPARFTARASRRRGRPPSPRT